MRAWFERPDAPSKRAVAKAIKCDPSELTVILRLSTDRKPGPQTSVIAERLAEHIGIPLSSVLPDEFSESDRLFRRLAEMNRTKAEHHLAALRDAITAETLSRPDNPDRQHPTPHGEEGTGGPEPQAGRRRRH